MATDKGYCKDCAGPCSDCACRFVSAAELADGAEFLVAHTYTPPNVSNASYHQIFPITKAQRGGLGVLLAIVVQGVQLFFGRALAEGRPRLAAVGRIYFRNRPRRYSARSRLPWRKLILRPHCGA